MTKIYIVVETMTVLGEKFGQNIIGVFDSKEGAIGYIKRSFGSRAYTYNSDDEEYCLSNEYYTLTRWIVEQVLNRGYGDS